LGNFVSEFLSKVTAICESIDEKSVENAICLLEEVKKNQGRLFLAGNGGGAGHASHACNDFRKICEIESYCLSDNISELTARINDEGWDSAYSAMLTGSSVCKTDAVLIFSVGGGSLRHNVSMNLIECAKTAKRAGAKVLSIVGYKPDSYLMVHSDYVISIPATEDTQFTALVEGMQAVIWHMLVSSHALQSKPTKWAELKEKK
jgi:D-sedoheptulose 7-phosphate isomerase